MGPGPFTPDPLGSTWPAPFPWLSFGFSGPVPGFSLETVGGPAAEPVDVATAKKQARIDYADEDALFAVWIAAARQLVEREAQTCFVPQTLRLSLPGWPADGQVRLPVGPAVRVLSLRYFDAGGAQQTLTEGVDFQTWLAYRPPLVLPYPQKYWPVVRFGQVPTVTIDYTAGYGAVPELAKAAILMAVDYWAANRGDEEAPEKLGLPPGCLRLIRLLSTMGYR